MSLHQVKVLQGMGLRKSDSSGLSSIDKNSEDQEFVGVKSPYIRRLTAKKSTDTTRSLIDQIKNMQKETTVTKIGLKSPMDRSENQITLKYPYMSPIPVLPTHKQKVKSFEPK